MDEITDLHIQIAPTANGQGTYIQIASPGAMPVNIVLVASGEVTVEDAR